MPNSIQIEELAAAWLARRDGDSWNAVEQAKLDTWLAASTAHRVAYIRLEAAWQRARLLEAIESESQSVLQGSRKASPQETESPKQ